MSHERWLDYSEAKEWLKNNLSHSDARAAVLILYRATGGNRHMSRAAVLRIAEGVQAGNERARGDRDRKPFQKQSRLWGNS